VEVEDDLAVDAVGASSGSCLFETWTRRSWAWWATRFLGERVVSMWREVVYRVAKGEQEDDEVSGADVCSASWYSPHTSAKRDEMLVEIQSFSI
jgi:hypothetical protein